MTGLRCRRLAEGHDCAEEGKETTYVYLGIAMIFGGKQTDTMTSDDASVDSIHRP